MLGGSLDFSVHENFCFLASVMVLLRVVLWSRFLLSVKDALVLALAQTVPAALGGLLMLQGLAWLNIWVSKYLP